jgi:hypothetical protein
MTPDPQSKSEAREMWRELESAPREKESAPRPRQIERPNTGSPFDLMNEAHDIEITRVIEHYEGAVQHLENRIIEAEIECEDMREEKTRQKQKIDRLWLGIFAAGLFICYLVGKS